MRRSVGRASGEYLGRVSTRIRLILAVLVFALVLAGALFRLGGIAGSPQTLAASQSPAAPQSPMRVGAPTDLRSPADIGAPTSLGAPASLGESPPELIAEPPATAVFVRAYGHGDYSTLEQVASPLYFVEWDRQGVSRQAQASFIQTHQTTATGEWLRLIYATGHVDARDFGHYIYVGYPISAAGGAVPSVWRVDSDSDGRVIWIDLVWLFSAQTISVDAVLPTSDPDALTALAAAAPGITGVLFGVRSAAGRDGYYGIRQRPREGGGDSLSGRLIFYAVDAEGRLRPGAWAFGERFPGRPLPGRVQLPDQESDLLRRYLASLR